MKCATEQSLRKHLMQKISLTTILINGNLNTEETSVCDSFRWSIIKPLLSSLFQHTLQEVCMFLCGGVVTKRRGISNKMIQSIFHVNIQDLHYFLVPYLMKQAWVTHILNIYSWCFVISGHRRHIFEKKCWNVLRQSLWVTCVSTGWQWIIFIPLRRQA